MIPQPLGLVTRREFLGSTLAGVAGTWKMQRDASSLETQFSCTGVDLYAERETVTRVTLHFSDGGTETFTGRYDGEQGFGYDQSDAAEKFTASPLDRSSPGPAGFASYSQFHGMVTSAEVVLDGRTRTVERPTELLFETSADCLRNVSFSGTDLTIGGGRGNDLLVTFADGTTNWYQQRFDFTETPRTFGAPGRTVERVLVGAEVSPFRLSLSNPHPTEPTTETATTFAGTSVRVGRGEFTLVPPRVASATLTFGDGTSQRFGDAAGKNRISLPETFEGTGGNAGKLIESVELTHTLQSGTRTVVTIPNPNVDAGSTETTTATRRGTTNATSGTNATDDGT